MGDSSLITQILGEGPLAAFVIAVIAVLGAFSRGLWNWVRGRHDRERTESKDRRDTISTLKQEVKAAEQEADEARAEAVRQHNLALGHQQAHARVWEYANTLRQRLICKHQERPGDLPPWPET